MERRSEQIQESGNKRKRLEELEDYDSLKQDGKELGRRRKAVRKNIAASCQG